MPQPDHSDGRALERERAASAAAEARVAELEARLLDAEQRTARIGDLELELREVTTRYHVALEHERHERREAEAAFTLSEERRGATEELLERARRVQDELEGSVSWRITAPLRAARRHRP